MGSQTTRIINTSTISPRESARLHDLIAALAKIRALARINDEGRIQHGSWTIGWHPAHDRKVCVTATYPSAIKLIDRVELSAQLVSHGYRICAWNDGKHGTDLVFFLPGPFHVVQGTDCAGELTLEIRETTSIQDKKSLEKALRESYEQWSAA